MYVLILLYLWECPWAVSLKLEFGIPTLYLHPFSQNGGPSPSSRETKNCPISRLPTIKTNTYTYVYVYFVLIFWDKQQQKLKNTIKKINLHMYTVSMLNNKVFIYLSRAHLKHLSCLNITSRVCMTYNNKKSSSNELIHFIGCVASQWTPMSVCLLFDLFIVRSVGCHNSLKARKLHFHCSFQSTCLLHELLPSSW